MNYRPSSRPLVVPGLHRKMLYLLICLVILYIFISVVDGAKEQKGRSLKSGAGDKSQGGRSLKGAGGKGQAGRTLKGGDLKGPAGRSLKSGGGVAKALAGRSLKKDGSGGKAQAGRSLKNEGGGAKKQSGRSLKPNNVQGGRSLKANGGKAQSGRSLKPSNAQAGRSLKAQVTKVQGGRSLKAPSQNKHMILEVVFLVDRTSQKIMKKAPKIIEFLTSHWKKDYPGSKFGLTLFADFQCKDAFPEDRCTENLEENKRHSEPEGCYTLQTKLTETPAKVLKAAESIKRLHAENGTKSAIAAVMLTAVDKRIGWHKKLEATRFKIIFVLTDAGTHCCEKPKGIKKPPKGDGTDKCATMNNPTPQFTGKRLRERKIGIFLVLGKDGSMVNPYKNWKEMGTRTKVPFGMADFEKDGNDGILKKFKAYLVSFLKSYKTGAAEARALVKGVAGRSLDVGGHKNSSCPPYIINLRLQLRIASIPCCGATKIRCAKNVTTTTPIPATEPDSEEEAVKTTTVDYEDEIAPEERTRRPKNVITEEPAMEDITETTTEEAAMEDIAETTTEEPAMEEEALKTTTVDYDDEIAPEERTRRPKKVTTEEPAMEDITQTTTEEPEDTEDASEELVSEETTVEIASDETTETPVEGRSDLVPKKKPCKLNKCENGCPKEMIVKATVLSVACCGKLPISDKKTCPWKIDTKPGKPFGGEEEPTKLEARVHENVKEDEVEEQTTILEEESTTTEGEETTTEGEESTTEGEESTTTEGEESTTAGEESTTEGEESTTEGEESTTAGEESTTAGEESTTEGEESTTEGEESTTAGEESTTQGEESTTQGEESTTGGEESTTTEGEESTTAGEESTTAGEESTTAGEESTTEGEESTTAGENSTTEGEETSSAAPEVLSTTFQPEGEKITTKRKRGPKPTSKKPIVPTSN